MESFKKLLTPPEVAELLGLDHRTLANWRSNGQEELRYLKIGNRVRYDPADVRVWLESKREV